MTALVMLVLLAVGSTATAGELPNVVYKSCAGGDTCTFTIPQVPQVLGEKLEVRLAGVDAPDWQGRCGQERRLARAARELVHQILSTARSIQLKEVTRGAQFSLVAQIDADGVLVNQLLLQVGLAVPRSDRVTTHNWCAVRD